MVTRNVEHSRAVASPEREQESITQLLRRLSDELLTLFRQEMALATAEISATVTKLLMGLSAVAAGGLVLYAGVLALVAAAVLGLSSVVSAWLAALIVGAAVALIGAILLYVGLRAMGSAKLTPKRTVQSLTQDKDVLLRRES